MFQLPFGQPHNGSYMSTTRYRSLLRLFGVAFLLLLGRSMDGRARVPERHRGTPTIEAANATALLASTPFGKSVHHPPAQLPVLAAIELGSSIRSELLPPADDRLYIRTRERATGEAARPPPLEA